MQKYQFEAEFSLGKSLIVSDTLSQALLKYSKSHDKDAYAKIHMLFKGLLVFDNKFELLEKEICNDQTLVSDNGPQFASEKFRQFLKDWEIQYDPTSPRYPKAIGIAESAFKSVKSLFKKAHTKLMKTHT